jgi:hypothetical protein
LIYACAGGFLPRIGCPNTPEISANILKINDLRELRPSFTTMGTKIHEDHLRRMATGLSPLSPLPLPLQNVRELAPLRLTHSMLPQLNGNASINILTHFGACARFVRGGQVLASEPAHFHRKAGIWKADWDGGMASQAK